MTKEELHGFNLAIDKVEEWLLKNAAGYISDDGNLFYWGRMINDLLTEMRNERKRLSENS